MSGGKRGHSDRSDSTIVNRRTFLKATGVAGATTVCGVGAASSGTDSRVNQVLVGVSKSVNDVESFVADQLPSSAELVSVNETLSYAVVSFPGDEASGLGDDFAASITDQSNVRYAERNATYNAAYTPNDPMFGDQYAPQMVDADDAWDTTMGTSDVTIAVVDTGVQYDHDDLGANFGEVPGYDFVDDDADPYPDDLSEETHGTCVAGVAGAGIDDETGIAGTTEVTLLSARVLNELGWGTASDVADGIQWAADRDADVINVSLSGRKTSAVEDAVSYATEQGSLVVAAAGNDDEGVRYPAAHPDAIAVSALDPDGSFASYSNSGDEIELTAPGTQVLTTTTDGHATHDGTSMATSVVSGVAGLATAQWDDLTNRDLHRHLCDTAADVGLAPEKQGHGRVDAGTAVSDLPVQIVDDFETGALDTYEFDRGQSGASMVSNPTFRGSKALKCADTTVEAISTSGLANYPEAGDAFKCNVRASTGDENANFTYGVQDHENRYYVKVDFDIDRFRIFKYSDGSAIRLAGQGNLSLEADEWYEIEISWRASGTHVATLSDSSGMELARLSAVDKEWTSGGIGFDAYLRDGEAVHFDDVTLDLNRATVLEDFESSSMADYSGHTDGHAVVQGRAPLERSSMLEARQMYGMLAHDEATTERGYEYRTLVRTGQCDCSEIGLLTSVQNTDDPLEAGYMAFLDASSGQLRLVRRQYDNSVELDAASYDSGAETTYELALEVGSGTVKAVVYDRTGTKLAETDTVMDDTYSGGSFGFYTGEAAPVYYDYLIQTPLDE